MSNKWVKRLIGLIAIGTAIAGAIVYFTKKKGCSCDCDEDFSDDFEDEDFDLDDDLKEVSREYVSLTPEPAKETEETDSTEDSPAAETEEE